jgi:putative transposase
MKTFSPETHHRRSIRLKDYDYSQSGGYFITIATYQRSVLFGEITEQAMFLNQYGEIVQSCWERIVKHYVHVELDSFIIMPNHIHGIIFITDVGAGLKPAPTKRYLLI